MRQYLFLLFIIIMFLNCSSKKDEKKKSENDLPVVDNTYINFIMENDTLDTKLEKGMIKYFYKINDTIKLSPRDKRRVYVTFALIPHGENKKKFGVGERIEKELHFSPMNTSDTISIPFTIKPHFSGKGIIVGVLNDTYELATSDKEKVRLLSNEITFKQYFYIN